MDRPDLTIAIPTWNRAAILSEGLDVVLQRIRESQVEGAVDVLVSDNGSTDDTEHVARTKSVGSRIITYRRNQENLGARANWLQTIASARGKYCLVLGDDERLAAGALQRILKLVESNAPVFFLQQAGETNLAFRDLSSRRPLTIDELLSKYLQEIGFAGVFVLDVDLAKSIIAKHQFEWYSETWPQTQVILLMLASAGETALFAPIPCASSTLHGALTIYSSCYVWRAMFADLLAGIYDIRATLGAARWRIARRYLAGRLRAIRANLMFYAVFVDDDQQRKRTAAAVTEVLYLLPMQSIPFAIGFRVICLVSQSLARAAYRHWLRLRIGKALVDAIEQRAVAELEFRKSAAGSKAVRELLATSEE